MFANVTADVGGLRFSPADGSLNPSRAWQITFAMRKRLASPPGAHQSPLESTRVHSQRTYLFKNPCPPCGILADRSPDSSRFKRPFSAGFLIGKRSGKEQQITVPWLAPKLPAGHSSQTPASSYVPALHATHNPSCRSQLTLFICFKLMCRTYT